MKGPRPRAPQLTLACRPGTIPASQLYDEELRLVKGIKVTARAHQNLIWDRRQLSNRLVGIIHGYLKTRTTYNEAAPWAHHTTSGCSAEIRASAVQR